MQNNYKQEYVILLSIAQFKLIAINIFIYINI